jgi:hypothetical protein
MFVTCGSINPLFFVFDSLSNLDCGQWYKFGISVVVEWSRALDVRLSEWYCSVSMVWVQIPSREEQKIWQL